MALFCFFLQPLMLVYVIWLMYRLDKRKRLLDRTIEMWQDRIMDAGAAGELPPKPALLFCPWCYAQHFDEGVWATRPHHKHLCARCGGNWRVEPYAFGADLPILKLPPYR